jgi:hypothetical protein
MKKTTTLIFILTTLFSINANSQDKSTGSQYGNTLNLGLGIGGYSGYYGYVGRTLPVLNVNYELSVAKNFTLAPFISFYTYSNSYYWGNKNYPYRYYTYRETVVPIGLKGTYYFDDLLKANSKWDFYLAGSLGFAIVSSTWDNDYYGDKNYYSRGNPLFLDVHVGAEYHFNNHIGAFLDLSTGVSTIGISIR